MSSLLNGKAAYGEPMRSVYWSRYHLPMRLEVRRGKYLAIAFQFDRLKNLVSEVEAILAEPVIVAWSTKRKLYSIYGNDPDEIISHTPDRVKVVTNLTVTLTSRANGIELVRIRFGSFPSRLRLSWITAYHSSWFVEVDVQNEDPDKAKRAWERIGEVMKDRTQVRASHREGVPKWFRALQVFLIFAIAVHLSHIGEKDWRSARDVSNILAIIATPFMLHALFRCNVRLRPARWRSLISWNPSQVAVNRFGLIASALAIPGLIVSIMAYAKG